MSFQVEKGVPLEKVRTGRAGESIYPFDSMEVGDSFFVPTLKQRSTVSSIMAAAQAFKPKRFTCRSVTEEHHAAPGLNAVGVRCWRIEDFSPKYWNLRITHIDGVSDKKFNDDEAPQYVMYGVPDVIRDNITALLDPRYATYQWVETEVADAGGPDLSGEE